MVAATFAATIEEEATLLASPPPTPPTPGAPPAPPTSPAQPPAPPPAPQLDTITVHDPLIDALPVIFGAIAVAYCCGVLTGSLLPVQV